MSVLGAMSRRDKGAAPVLPNLEQPPDPTGFFQNVGAGFEQAKAGPHSTRNARAIYESRYYDQIISALNAEGERATDYVESPVRRDSPFYRAVPGEQVRPDGRVFVPSQRPFTNPFSEGPSTTRDVNPLANLYLGGDAAEMNNIWSAVNRVRQRKGPGFLKDFSDSAALDALAMKQRQADLVQAQDVTSRAGKLGEIGAFIGRAAGSIASLDPENAVAGFTGAAGKAAGKSVARQIIGSAVKGAAANAAAGAVAVPGQVADAASLGQPMMATDAFRSVGGNMLAGAVLGSAHVTIPAAASAVGKVAGSVVGKVAENLPAGVRDPIVAASIRAGTVKDRSLLYEFQRQHQPYSVADTSTPDERAAAHVVTRDVETQEQSPLQPEHAPVNDHRLDTIAAALGVDLTPPDAPTSAPVQTPTVRDHSQGATAPRRPATFVEGINAAEGSTRNPRSSADGYGNFIDSTWLSVAPRVTDTAGMSREQILALRHDKDIAGRATAYYAQQNGNYLRARGLEDSPGNLSLAHFAGPEGAAKLLKADPDASAESILGADAVRRNPEVLKGKTAGDVVAWAHKRIGAAVDQPPARADAVPDEGYDPGSPVPYAVETLRADELPPTSAAAPTDEPFNPTIAQHLLVWEAADGRRELIDGGKRLAHARSQDDQSVTLPAVVLKEADGVSEEMAMLVGKLKNVNLGTASLEDAAGNLADIPEIAAALRSPQFKREIAAIAQLPYEDFGAVVNGAVEPLDAINRMAGATYYYDGGSRQRVHHEGQNRPSWVPADGDVALGRFENGLKPGKSAVEVRHVIHKGNNLTWIGIVRPSVDAKFGDRSNVARVGVWLRDARVRNSAGLLKDLDRLSRWASDHSNAANVGRSPELQSAFRRLIAEHTGEPLGGAGRDLAAEAPDADLPSGSQPSLFDSAIAQRDRAEAFSDPVGAEAKQQTALLEHDLRPPKPEGDQAKEGETPEAPPVADTVHLFDLPSTGFRLTEEGEKPVTLKEALDDADADEAAAKALRDCL
jgi:hypothetical protein